MRVKKGYGQEETMTDTLLELIQGADVKWKTLGEVGEFVRGNGMQKKDFVESGFPAVHYGQIYTRYGLSADKTFSFVSEELASKLRIADTNDLLIATTSENDEDVCKSVAWLGGKVAISGDMMFFRHHENVKYLMYYFHSESFQKDKKGKITGTKVRRVSSANLAKIKIPIPSLEIQQKVVEILDKMTDYVMELTAELTLRQKQYAYYRDQLLTFPSQSVSDESVSVKWMTLGEIGEVRMCKRILKSQTSSTGEVPFFKIGTFGKKPNAFISRALFEEYKEKYSYPKVGDLLISASGTIGRIVKFDGKDAYFQDSNIVWIDNDETQVRNDYLRYYYQIANWGTSQGGTITRLYNDGLKKMKIAVPPLELQYKIVEILDKFDNLTSDLSEGLPREIELRQKQYEYWQEQLLSFKKE